MTRPEDWTPVSRTIGEHYTHYIFTDDCGFLIVMKEKKRTAVYQGIKVANTCTTQIPLSEWLWLYSSDRPNEGNSKSQIPQNILSFPSHYCTLQELPCSVVGIAMFLWNTHLLFCYSDHICLQSYCVPFKNRICYQDLLPLVHCAL